MFLYHQNCQLQAGVLANFCACAGTTNNACVLFEQAEKKIKNQYNEQTIKNLTVLSEGNPSFRLKFQDLRLLWVTLRIVLKYEEPIFKKLKDVY